MIPALPHLPQSMLNQHFPSVTAHVKVQRIHFNPCQSLNDELALVINPLSASENMGCDIFHHAIRIVGLHLRASCSQCIDTV